MKAIFTDLKEKKILITGATRGIGRALSESLAEQGAHVIFNLREGDKNTLAPFTEHLLKCGASKATPVTFDVTNTAQIKEALDDFNSKHGVIEGLVNNAGISRDQLVLRMKEEDVTATLDTNLKGAIMVTQILSRGFLRAASASIVNISSVVGLMGNAGQTAYAASKAGMIGMTKSLAKELGSKNVRCNAICPGFIDTNMTETLKEDIKESYLAGIPMKRFGTTQEISNLVNFLLSDASSYITGESIKIDGGLYT